MNAENTYTHSTRSLFIIVCLSTLDIGRAIYHRKFKNFQTKPKYIFPLRSFTIMPVLFFLEIRFSFVSTLHFKKSSIVLVQLFYSKVESKL